MFAQWNRLGELVRLATPLEKSCFDQLRLTETGQIGRVNVCLCVCVPSQYKQLGQIDDGDRAECLSRPAGLSELGNTLAQANRHRDSGSSLLLANLVVLIFSGKFADNVLFSSKRLGAMSHLDASTVELYNVLEII